MSSLRFIFSLAIPVTQPFWNIKLQENAKFKVVLIKLAYFLKSLQMTKYYNENKPLCIVFQIHVFYFYAKTY